MRSLKEKLGLTWITPQYFLAGWSYFFQQEVSIIGIWIFIGLLASHLVGCCDSFCLVTYTILVIIIRRILAGGICTSDKRLDGKIVVITGSNAGIGKETAKDLLSRGAEIILACRDLKKANKAKTEILLNCEGKIGVMELDLSSFASIQAFAKEFSNNYNQLDILVNNAGIMMCPEMKTQDGLEMQIGTNHFGHFLLTNLLMKYLQKAKSARVVNVSSLGHWFADKNFLDDINCKKGYDARIAYGNSKLANILFTTEFNRKFAGSQVTAYALHPGVVESNLGRHIPLGIDILYGKMMHLVAKATAEGAQTTIYSCLEAQPCEYSYFSDCAPANSSDLARDANLAQKLWTISETTCKVQFRP